jgi:peptidoglycan/xylan/chitin deacetylase (PgdA/CDA1 family)
MAEEVARAQAAIAAAGGGRPAYFRAPAGIQNPWLNFVLSRAGLSLVSWTRRGFDTVSADPIQVATRLIGPGLRAGDILLLHDRISGAGSVTRAVVLEALPRVLDAMAGRGLRSEPLPRGDETGGLSAG